MPLFDFLCNDCGATTELLVKSARAKVACPECGSRKTQRLLSTFAVRAPSGPAPARCDMDSPCSKRPCHASGVCPHND